MSEYKQQVFIVRFYFFSSNYHSKNVGLKKIEKWRMPGGLSWRGVGVKWGELCGCVEGGNKENEYGKLPLTKYDQSLFKTQALPLTWLQSPLRTGRHRVPCLLHVRTCWDYKYSRHIVPSKNSSSRFLWACFDFLFSVFWYFFSLLNSTSCSTCCNRSKQFILYFFFCDNHKCPQLVTLWNFFYQSTNCLNYFSLL